MMNQNIKKLNWILNKIGYSEPLNTLPLYELWQENKKDLIYTWEDDSTIWEYPYQLIDSNNDTLELYLSVDPIDFLEDSITRSISTDLTFFTDKSTILCYTVKPHSLTKTFKTYIRFSEDRDTIALLDGDHPTLPKFKELLLSDVLPKAFAFGAKFKRCKWSNDTIKYITKPNGERYGLTDRWIMLGGELYPFLRVFDITGRYIHEDDESLKHFYYCGLFRPKNLRQFHLQKTVPCIKCGQLKQNLYTPLCDDCENGVLAHRNAQVTCVNCGQKFIYDSVKETTDDFKLICPSCREYETSTCLKCGGIFLKQDLLYDLCEDCLNEERSVPFEK